MISKHAVSFIILSGFEIPVHALFLPPRNQTESKLPFRYWYTPTETTIRIDFVMSVSTAEYSCEKTSIEEDEEVNLLPNDSLNGQRHASLRYRLRYWSCVLALLFFIISHAVFVFLYLNGRGQTRCLLGQEAIYDDPPITYETVTFQRTGFHDLAHNHRTVYEGRPDPENNKAWERLMSGGIQS